MAHRPGLRELALKRQMLATLADLQRAQLRHELRNAPWMAALHGAQSLLRWAALVRAALRRPPAAAPPPPSR